MDWQQKASSKRCRLLGHRVPKRCRALTASGASRCIRSYASRKTSLSTGTSRIFDCTASTTRSKSLPPWMLECGRHLLCHQAKGCHAPFVRDAVASSPACLCGQPLPFSRGLLPAGCHNRAAVSWHRPVSLELLVGSRLLRSLQAKESSRLRPTRNCEQRGSYACVLLPRCCQKARSSALCSSPRPGM